MPTFSASVLESFCRDLFQAANVPPGHAAIVARSLVDANLCGHDSHGVMRIPQYLGYLKDGTFQSKAAFTILNETPAAIAADGGWGLGQVQAHELLSRLIPKSQVLGIAAGTLRHCGHIGRLGEYAEVCAAKNLTLFATVNSHGSGRRVAPPGGKEGRISTNPICLGVPTSGPPVVLDFGTSVAAEGKVRGHFQKQEPVPAGWLHDHEGKPTADPSVLYKEPRGSILPFGGDQQYKGFGLGLLLDLLAGGLSGGRCSNPGDPMTGVGNAVVFIVMDPAQFGGTQPFLNQADGLTQYVRGCPTTDPNGAITLPGDPERKTKASRQASGMTIPEGTWALITNAANELGVACPKSPL
ncbi:MAG: Ldh family oxidoreductase [Gemmataceae bacterium]